MSFAFGSSFVAVLEFTTEWRPLNKIRVPTEPDLMSLISDGSETSGSEGEAGDMMSSLIMKKDR